MDTNRGRARARLALFGEPHLKAMAKFFDRFGCPSLGNGIPCASNRRLRILGLKKIARLQPILGSKYAVFAIIAQRHLDKLRDG